MFEISSFLKQLISLPGLSSGEEPVRTVIAETWKPLVDEIAISRTGSLHGFKRGDGPEPRPRILLAAHMDAIGLLVTQVVDGFLRFTQVGGIDDRILPGQLVTVHTASRDLPAMIIQPPDHMLPVENKGKPVKMQMLYIDTGLRPDEVEKLVRIGDLVSFAQEPLELGGETLAGHSLDNRASVAAVTVCLQELRKLKHSWDVWVAATVQEEETLLGGATSAFQLEPNIAVAIDVTFAKSPGASDYRTSPLGKGITIGIGPNIHPELHQVFKKLAEKLDIPFKVEVMPVYSGTDADAMVVSAGGIPTFVLGIPLRYMHTPVEMVSLKDIERAGRLLAQFIAGMEPGYMQTLADHYYQAPVKGKGK
ncbi:MAG: M20/M25/M40 family metallo-hydrolase [Anaerolineaceae bacterium]